MKNKIMCSGGREFREKMLLGGCAPSNPELKEMLIMNASDVVVNYATGEFRIKRKYGDRTRPVFKITTPNAGEEQKEG